MAFEPRGIQRWAAIVCACTAHGRTVAPHDFGVRVAPSFEAPFDGADSPDPLVAFLLGMAVGFIHGLRGLTEIMDVAEVVRHLGEHFRDGTADGPLAVRHDADNRPPHSVTHRLEQDCQIRVGRGQQPAGEEDCSGAAIPEDPKHLMADVRLQPVEREYDPPLGLRDPLEAGGVSQRQGEEFVLPFEEMAHGPGGDGHTALAQVVMDCGETAMLRGPQGPDRRNAIKAKLVPGSRQATRCFRTGGTAELRTVPVETTPDVQREMDHVFQGRDRTIVMRGRPHRLTADGAMTPKRLEGAGGRWSRTRRWTCHGESFPGSRSPV